MSCHVMLFGPSYLVFKYYYYYYYYLVFKYYYYYCCKTMELCETKAKNGSINLQIGGYLADNPWDTLLLALVGEV